MNHGKELVEYGKVWEDIFAMAGKMNLDEIKVLRFVAEGLTVGREQYGALALATDIRDFHHEAGQELRDMLVYVACAELKRQAK